MDGKIILVTNYMDDKLYWLENVLMVNYADDKVN